MKQFCIFIKTYRNDLVRTIMLLKSIEKYNRDNIDVVVSVPSKDYYIFKDKCGDKINLLKDEDVYDGLVDKPLFGFSPGYINQQLIKLTFWKKGMYKFYLCLDSDAYFIRDFYYKDFFYDSDTPYTNIYEWEPHFLNIDHFEWIDIYKRNIDSINNILGHNISKYITCCSSTILSANMLKSLEEYITIKEMDYIDLLSIAPFEFSWYNQWLIKNNHYRIVPVSGFFKVFHFRDDYIEARRKLVKESDIKKMYVGIVLNSNWKPIPPPYKYKDPDFINYFSYYIRKYAKRIVHKLYKIFIRIR